jgi:phosphomannomutase
VVLHEKADVGIIFDTDVDRAAAVDRKGVPIIRNRFIALLAAIVLREVPGATIVTDSVTSTGLKQWIEELGGVHHRFKRGYRNVINEAIRLNNTGIEAPLAIETSGHGAFKENYFLDDGAYQVAKLLIELSNHKADTSDGLETLIEGLKEPFLAKEFRVQFTGNDQEAERILSELSAWAETQGDWYLTPDNIEGIHVTTQTGWLLIRRSLHDPQFVINMEWNTKQAAYPEEVLLREKLDSYSELTF